MIGRSRESILPPGGAGSPLKGFHSRTSPSGQERCVTCAVPRSKIIATTTHTNVLVIIFMVAEKEEVAHHHPRSIMDVVLVYTWFP